MLLPANIRQKILGDEKDVEITGANDHIRVVASKASEASWEKFQQDANGAFAYFCSLLGEPYQSAKHDDAWFSIYDEVIDGKDPDEFTQDDVKRLFEAIAVKMDDSAMPY